MVRRVPRALLVQRAIQELRVWLVRRVPRVLKELLVQLLLQEQRVPRVFKELRVSWVIQEIQELKVSWEIQDIQEPLVILVI